MTPDRTSDTAPPLDAFRAQLATFAARAVIARGIIDDAKNAGASDLAGALALLAEQRVYSGDDPTTKLQRLHSSVRESIAAGRAVAEVLGIDLAESETGPSVSPADEPPRT